MRDGNAPPSLREKMRFYTSIADVGQLHLSNDGVFYTLAPDMIGELCDIAKQRMVKEVCSRLQQLVTSQLCRKLKEVVREEIRKHPERCEKCKVGGRAAARTAVRSAFTNKTGMIIMALIVVAAVSLAAAMPGMPLNPSSSPANTTLYLYSLVSRLNAGISTSLAGALKTNDGSGLGSHSVKLQRQEGETWVNRGQSRRLMMVRSPLRLRARMQPLRSRLLPLGKAPRYLMTPQKS